MKTAEDDGAGFTLIELMIVVAIIGILAAIAIPKFANLVRKSQEGTTKANLGALRSALSIYSGDLEGNYPNDDLACLTIDAKYIKEIPKARAPAYHTEHNGVCTSLAVTASNCTLGLGAPAGYDGHLNPLWVYWDRSDAPPMFGPARYKGEIWVGCTHTDTRGSFWSTY